MRCRISYAMAYEKKLFGFGHLEGQNSQKKSRAASSSKKKKTDF